VFNANTLCLNIYETNFMQFSSKNSSLTNLNITCDNKVLSKWKDSNNHQKHNFMKIISNISNMKFLE